MSPELEAVIDENGYLAPCYRNGELVAVGPFLFTVAIIVGIDATGYRIRYCYPTLTHALDALRRWDEGEPEPPDYIVAKG